jgi:hypothetical protein
MMYFLSLTVHSAHPNLVDKKSDKLQPGLNFETKLTYCTLNSKSKLLLGLPTEQSSDSRPV